MTFCIKRNISHSELVFLLFLIPLVCSGGHFLAHVMVPDEQGKVASSSQLQEGHDPMSQQQLGIHLETAWQSQGADFINLQLDAGHVSVSTL